MKRREFITLLGGAAAVWPLAARAQQRAMPVIGYLSVGSPESDASRLTGLRRGLNQTGYIEGRSLVIEYRWAGGRPDRWTELAAELAGLRVDIVVTASDPAVRAAKQAMPATPIVFAIASDPVGRGLVSSLARPGGSVTGLANLVLDTVGKRLELLREIIPALDRVAVMANAGFPEALLEMEAFEPLAKAQGLDVTAVEIRRTEDIAPALEHLGSRAQALYVCPDPLMLVNRLRIVTVVLGLRLPTMYAYRDYVEAGGLISYGPNIAVNFRRAAEFVDKILRGTKPGDLPVEQPTKFDLVINLITARALGLTIAPPLLARADEVIE